MLDQGQQIIHFLSLSLVTSNFFLLLYLLKVAQRTLQKSLNLKVSNFKINTPRNLE